MRKQTKEWTMRDGRKIRICDMADIHLLSTIAMLERNAERQRQENLRAMFCVVPPTAEQAEIAFDQAVDEAIEAEAEDFLPEIYENLVAEAQRRGI